MDYAALIKRLQTAPVYTTVTAPTECHLFLGDVQEAVMAIKSLSAENERVVSGIASILAACDARVEWINTLARAAETEYERRVFQSVSEQWSAVGDLLRPLLPVREPEKKPLPHPGR